MTDEEAGYRTRLGRNTAASVVANVWTMALLLVSIPVLVAGLGTDRFGVWALIQTLSATNGWLSVITIGLGISLTRHVAEAHGAGAGDDGAVVASGIAVHAAVGVVAGLLVALAGPALVEQLLGSTSDDLRLTMACFGVQVAAELVCGALTSTLEGIQRVDQSRGLDVLRRTLVVLATGAAALTAGTLPAVAAAAAGATVVALLVAALGPVRRQRWGRPRAGAARSIARYGTTLGGLTATGVVHRTMDRTIAGVAFGPGSVALVEVANQIQVGCTAILSAITYPVLSSGPWLRARRDEGALLELLTRTTRYSVLATLPLVATAAVLAAPFVRAWVGDDLGDAAGLTQLAVLYVAVVAPVQATSNHLQGAGRAGLVLRASLLSVAVNLVASVLLVEVIGLAGVFLGTLAGSFVVLPMLLRAARTDLGRSLVPVAGGATWRALPASAAAAGAAGLAVWAPLGDLTTVVVGGALAVAAATPLVLRVGVDPGELRGVTDAIRRRAGRPATEGT